MVLNLIENPSISHNLQKTFLLQNDVYFLPELYPGLKYNRFHRLISPAVIHMQPLAFTEAKLFELFLINQNQLLSSEQIFTHLHPNEIPIVGETSIQAKISRLRGYLSKVVPNFNSKETIKNDHGSVYMWVDNSSNKEEVVFPEPRQISDSLYYDYVHRAITDNFREKYFPFPSSETSQLFEILIYFANKIVDHGTLANLLFNTADSDFSNIPAIWVLKSRVQKILYEISEELGYSVKNFHNHGYGWKQIPKSQEQDIYY